MDAGQVGQGSDDESGQAEWKDYADVPTDEPDAPLLGHIGPEPGSITLVFGDGGTGKGTLVAYWAAQMIAAGGTVFLLDAEGHPREWARRVSGLLGHPLPKGRLTGPDRVNGYPVMPPEPVDLIIVDSAGYFTGDSVGHDDWASTAITMQDFAKDAETPLVVMGHVSKAAPGKAYGSGFWHNVARVSYELTNEDDGDVVLTCRKATDVASLHKGQQWTVKAEYSGVTPTSIRLQDRLPPAPPPSPESVAWTTLLDWTTKTDLMEATGWGDRKTRDYLTKQLGLQVEQDGPRTPKRYRRDARHR